MGVLVDAVTRAFAPGGPVEKHLKQHRPEQARGAVLLARTIERGRGNNPLPGITLLEIGTGVGKTLMILIVMALACRLNKTRGLVSTFTVPLRHQIREANADGTLDRIVSETLGDDTRIRLGERKSATGYASWIRWCWLSQESRRIAAGTSRRTISNASLEHLQAYLAWAGDAAGWKNYTPTDTFPDEYPEFAEWYEREDSDGRLPLGLGELDLCMTEREIAHSRSVMSSYAQSVADVASADIVIATHSMLLFNNQTFGHTLGTSNGGDHLPITMVVLDEGDQVPDVARNLAERMVSLQILEELLIDTPLPPRDKKDAKAALGTLTAHLLAMYDNAPVKVRPLTSRKSFLPVFELVSDLTQQLDRLALAEWPDDVVSQMHREKLIRAGNNLRSIVVQFTKMGSQEAEYRLTEEADSIVLVEHYPSREHIRIGLKPNTPNKLLRPLWRYGRSTATDSVTFVSGTLRGRTGKLADTLRRFSIWPTGDRADNYNADLSPPEGIHPPNFGVIGEFVQAHPQSPSPSLDKPIIRADGSVDFTNPEHLAYLAQAISWIAANRPDRSFGLFAAERAMMGVYERVPHLHDRIILQRAGQKSFHLLPQYIERPDAIWFGVNWEGMDLSHRLGDGLTSGLIRNLILTKIPMPPTDEIQTLLYGSYGSFAENLDRAFRKIQQGIGRGHRAPDDRVNLWCLDPRWPLPPNLVTSLRLGVNADQRSFAGFNATIPERFRRKSLSYNYEELCRVFTPDGRLIPEPRA
jgi:Rad3-related DNA helicase